MSLHCTELFRKIYSWPLILKYYIIASCWAKNCFLLWFQWAMHLVMVLWMLMQWWSWLEIGRLYQSSINVKFLHHTQTSKFWFSSCYQKAWKEKCIAHYLICLDQCRVTFYCTKVIWNLKTVANLKSTFFSGKIYFLLSGFGSKIVIN